MTEDRPAPGTPGRRRGPPQPLFLVAFLGLSLWLFAPAWSSPTGTTLAGGNGDPAIFIWFLRWVPFALEHGHDLLVAHHLNYPDGVNLMWNTSLLLPGHLAAAVGGLVYGFSPAIRTQVHHPHMSLAFLPPLMLLALHGVLVRRRRPPWLAGAALGLLAGCQLLTGEELLAMTGLLGFVLFLLLLLGNLRRLRGRVVHALVAFATAAVVFAAIAAWPLSVQFTGQQRVEGDIQITNRSGDLLGFVVPGAQQALSTDATAARVRRFAGGNSAYLGVPLLDSLIPSRVAQFTALCAGLLLALFLHAVWRGGGWRRAAAPVVGLAALAPLWPAVSTAPQQVAPRRSSPVRGCASCPATG